MKDFYQLIEARVDKDHSNELQFVNEMLFSLDQEALKDFEKKLDQLIAEKT